MLDERLKTRNESCSTSSPTLRHSREGGNLPRTTSRKSSSWRSAGPIGSIILFFLAITLAACTDYVQQMDDGFDEWEQAQKQKTLSSSSKTEMSCSSEELSSSSFSVILSSDSHEKSSSSTEKKNSSSSNNKASSSSAKSSSSNKVSNSSEQKNKSSSSVKASSSSSKVTSSSSTTKLSSSSAKAISSSSSKKDDVSSSSKKVEFSSSGKASWAYLNPAISYGEMIDDRDGQVYKTVKIGEQTWMAENLNFASENSDCYNDSAKYCAKYGRLYTWAATTEACPANWHLPDSTEWEILFTTVGGKTTAGQKLKTTSGWNSNGNGSNNYGFSALPAGFKNHYGNYSIDGNDAIFWSSSKLIGGNAYRMYLYFGNNEATLGGNEYYDNFSIRCIKNDVSKSSSSTSSSSSSKPSWAYLNPAISYGEMSDERDGQVYKTVVIDSKTWMAENLNYESVKSYCYENKQDSCSKYGRLYIWSAAMDSVGAFTTNSKGCGYPYECYYSKNPVRGVCPEKWHLPSQQEWYDLSTYNSSTIRGDLSSAGERLKTTNGWFNSGNGDNTYGFSIQPAGAGSEEKYSSSGQTACFWSSSDGNGIDAYGIHFEYSHSKGVLQGRMKSAGCSIRCVKD